MEAVIDSQSGETYYERDPQGQLIKENDITYRYDLGGNRIPEGGKVENDRLIETNNDKREYDTLGAEIRVIGKTTEHRKFDAEGQLIEVKKPGIHVTYGYDALGRRAWRKSEAGTTIYLWHNDVLMGEQDPEGQWQWYIRDPQTDAPLLIITNGERFCYELDHRMMPLRLWSGDGKLVWQGNADAWGRVRAEQAETTVHQPLRLPGQFEDELTGIVHNRHRDYDQSEGRYLTPDPLGMLGGLNTYRYTRNPVDYIDPLGLAFERAVTPESAVETEDAATQSLWESAQTWWEEMRRPDPQLQEMVESQGGWRMGLAPPVGPQSAYRVAQPAVQAARPYVLNAYTRISGYVGTGLASLGLSGDSAPELAVDDDVGYRTWMANGGNGTKQDWISEGRPDIGDSQWAKPKGWRLPVNRGRWLGEEGNSPWQSEIPEVNEITGGEPIPFRDGYPDFSQWSKADFEFDSLSGTHDDFSAVYEKVAEIKELPNKTAGKQYLARSGLTPHHHQDGRTIQLIPTKLHGNIPHQGGASNLRNGR